MDKPRILGLVLAGGLSRRMGAEKAFAMLGGRPLVAHALQILHAQCVGVAINANGEATRFAAFGVPVVADEVEDFPGPLAGILAGLVHARACGFDAILTLPVDTPLAPRDLLACLLAARGDSKIVVAASGGQAHHAVALWATSLAQDMRRALQVEGERGVARFSARYNPVAVDWPVGAVDPFFNINTPADLAIAERALSG